MNAEFDTITRVHDFSLKFTCIEKKIDELSPHVHDVNRASLERLKLFSKGELLGVHIKNELAQVVPRHKLKEI